jgi:hypothetical protein
MTRMRRSTTVVVWLAGAWALSWLVLLLPSFGPAAFRDNSTGVAWTLLWLLPIPLGIATVYWMVESVIRAVRARPGESIDA